MRVRRHRPGGRGRRGGALVEMAVIAPLFLTLVFGQIESSRLGMMCRVYSAATREGCRVAVLPTTTTATTVMNRINQCLQGSGRQISALSAVDSDPGTSGAFILPSNWATAAGGTAITVRIRTPYSQVSWLPTPLFLKTANVVGSATFNSERP